MFVPLHDDNKLRSIPFQFVTVGLIGLNIGVFLVLRLEQFGSFAVVPNEMLKVGYIGGSAHGPFDRVPVPEFFTLFSYMFVHGDVWHLLGNMLFLWVFGDNVEDAVGHFKFFVFYMLCGAFAALAYVVLSARPDHFLIGASGAVSGVVAAYLMLHPRVNVWVLVARIIPLRIRAIWILGLWIGIQVGMAYLGEIGVLKSQTAWWAHIGGLVAGAVLIVVMRRPGVPLFDRGQNLEDS